MKNRTDKATDAAVMLMTAEIFRPDQVGKLAEEYRTEVSKLDMETRRQVNAAACRVSRNMGSSLERRIQNG